jgi:hypothetical protein
MLRHHPHHLRHPAVHSHTAHHHSRPAADVPACVAAASAVLQACPAGHHCLLLRLLLLLVLVLPLLLQGHLHKIGNEVSMQQNKISQPII